MTDLTHAISGELWDSLAHGTQLDDGSNSDAVWGYGVTREVDIEVHGMVRSATSKRSGFGTRHTMTGSPDAWLAISAYAKSQAEIELMCSGDFDRGKGTRLNNQHERIEALVNDSTGREQA